MIKCLVDLRNQFGAARDQSVRPTCLAFAASDAHAGVRPGWTPLSTEWAYYHALKRDGGLPHQGTTLGSMLATLKSDGQPIESDWPYIVAPITNLTSWKPPRSVSQLFFRDHGVCPPTVQDVIQQLDAGYPVLVTMTLSDAFFRPERDGVIDSQEANDPKRRHAVVAVGHGRRGAETLVLVRNSWGEAWGLNGHAWIAVDYLALRLTGIAIITTEP